MESNKGIKEERSNLLYGLLVIISIIWLLSAILITKYFKSLPSQGQFGDMFGAVNSLFSGLAFAGVIYTIYLQKKELSLQRLELIETRKELARSATAQEKTEKALTQQVWLQNATAKLTSLNILIHYSKEKAERIKLFEPQLYTNLLQEIDRYAEEIKKLGSFIDHQNQTL